MPPSFSATIAPVYLSMTSAAARYDIHRDTIKRAINRGDLPAVCVGPRRQIRVRLTDLDAWALPVRNGAESTEG